VAAGKGDAVVMTRLLTLMVKDGDVATAPLESTILIVKVKVP
jgi:hypothetical protein